LIVSKPHVNVGRSVTWTREDVVDGGDPMTLGKRESEVAARSFESIDNAPEEKARGITITHRT